MRLFVAGGLSQQKASSFPFNEPFDNLTLRRW
jgi:hypothetical protein